MGFDSFFQLGSRVELPYPAAVLLDIDNTIYDYASAHNQAMIAVLRKAKNLLGVEEKSFELAFKKGRQEIKERLGHSASAHSRLLYIQRAIEIIGLKTQVLASLDLEQTYWRCFLAHANLLEGVRDFLEELSLLGIPCAVVTNLTTQIQFRKLIYFEITKYFEAIVTSEEVGVDKPSAEMFLLALSKLGIPTDTVVWMIGDDPQADIEGSKSAINAYTIQRKVPGTNLSSHADLSFSNFSELTGGLRRFQKVG